MFFISAFCRFNEAVPKTNKNIQENSFNSDLSVLISAVVFLQTHLPFFQETTPVFPVDY
jgi:hypothetical protein